MRKWFKALLSETLATCWWAISAFSTLATFSFPKLAGKPRLVLTASTILGFATANYKVFLSQERKIDALASELARHQSRRSDLLIKPAEGSRYILTPVNNVPHADFNGAFLEFRFLVENRGQRNSNIDQYAIEIVELNRTFTNLRPIEGRHSVQGRHCMHGLLADRSLSRTGPIRVNAETATDYGTLLFHLAGLNLDEFVRAGMRMEGPNRAFGSLHCRLTLTDTTGSSVTEEFTLPEH